MYTYYTSMRHAIKSLSKLALSHNKEVYQTIDIRYTPGIGIIISNKDDNITLDMELHTKKEMRSKLLDFIDSQVPEVVPTTTREIRANIKKTTAPRHDDTIHPYYANEANAVKSLNRIALKHDPKLFHKIDITHFPKIGIRISTRKSVLTFKVDEYTKYQLRSILVRYMEEMRECE